VKYHSNGRFLSGEHDKIINNFDKVLDHEYGIVKRSK
jgi:hypothetical protein